jgi:phenylacetic acid degradation operon negative regulatory protein
MSEEPALSKSGVNWTLLPRRAGDALLDMLDVYGETLATSGRPMAWSTFCPSENAYRTAVWRLQKAGVLSRRGGGKRDAALELTPKASRRRKRDLFNPDRFWKQKWRGLWSILTYDIEEKQRKFRDAFRRLLIQEGMGCLQRSVWISPYDVRSQYDELIRTMNIDFVSYLFEARTVLGRTDTELVRGAWDLESLSERQRSYIDGCRQALAILNAGASSREAVESLASEELAAYLAAMNKDPLLPKALLPPTYRGTDVLAEHRRFVEAVQRQMAGAH